MYIIVCLFYLFHLCHWFFGKRRLADNKVSFHILGFHSLTKLERVLLSFCYECRHLNLIIRNIFNGDQVKMVVEAPELPSNWLRGRLNFMNARIV